VPVHHELTTHQAAELLGVSRPHLVKLVDAGEIPHRKTGSHRRVYFEDLMRYRDVRDAERSAALRALARTSAEYGLDY
jgi:excisionase family DNA binding protein